MIRAVLDTNVIISSLLNPDGIPGRILMAWNKGVFELCQAEPLIEELGAVIQRPAIRSVLVYTDQEIQDILAGITQKSSLCKAGALKIKRVILDDPDDDVVLATALWAKADFIVSGDRHLQALGEYESIRIVTPRQFLEMIRGESSIF